MICVEIDELTSCLKDAQTGEAVATEVIRVRRKSFLKKFNKHNGWYTDWANLANENEIFALVVAGSVDIQGLIALQPSKNYGCVYVSWMCAAPENNRLYIKQHGLPGKRYNGVAGHLFAIAVWQSIKAGYGGAIMGFATNADLEQMYIEVFEAVPLNLLHPYQFFIAGKAAKRIIEVYDYDDKTDSEF